MVDRGGDRTGLPTDLRRETGPFDVIGDVHGCLLELEALLGALGYVISRDDADRAIGAHHPSGRTVVLLGDLADRGPDTPGVFRLVMGMATAGSGFSVLGNHDDKLLRALSGRKVRVTESLERALAQLHHEPAEFPRAVVAFVRSMRAHHVLDGGRLVVTHAGLPENLHGAESKAARRFCLWGESGDVHELGAQITGVGRALPGCCDGLVRAHPCDGAAVGEQHDVSGYRLRVRRVADRVAVPGARARRGAGGAGLPRAEATVWFPSRGSRDLTLANVDKRAKRLPTRPTPRTRGLSRRQVPLGTGCI